MSANIFCFHKVQDGLLRADGLVFDPVDDDLYLEVRHQSDSDTVAQLVLDVAHFCLRGSGGAGWERGRTRASGSLGMD